jgi:hypothetical protein
VSSREVSRHVVPSTRPFGAAPAHLPLSHVHISRSRSTILTRAGAFYLEMFGWNVSKWGPIEYWTTGYAGRSASRVYLTGSCPAWYARPAATRARRTPQ